jgi:light-harvesting protein B-800-850 alpha chain
MIYGKIWCVVKPSVGIPLFLSAVAISSFAVHLTLLTHVGWLKRYYQGSEGRVAMAPADAAPAAAAPPMAGAAPAAAAPKKP